MKAIQSVSGRECRHAAAPSVPLVAAAAASAHAACSFSALSCCRSFSERPSVSRLRYSRLLNAACSRGVSLLAGGSGSLIAASSAAVACALDCWLRLRGGAALSDDAMS